jgi:AraC-like DNA-binding protein
MFSLKTTGLQFGYFFALLFCVIFIIRGIKEDRLSDVMLGLIMFFMAMLIQDYTFGFEGINFLWDQWDGVPRHFPWLFPASVYFYFLAQTNVNFRLEKRHFLHLLPYVFYLILSLVLWGNGLTPKKDLYSSTLGMAWEIFVYLINYGGIFYYFVKSIKIYRHYKTWAENQYSNIYEIELKWLQNFLYIFLIGAIIHLINSVVDVIYDLPYDQDYYWQLFTVITIIYVGISGLHQNQAKKVDFVDEQHIQSIKVPKILSNDEMGFQSKLQEHMVAVRPYLNPDLTLKELASQLKTNSTFLSGIINQSFDKNFNDFINEYRVRAFESAIKDVKNKHLTLIAIAYDCGFNSKATFNRAVKKLTGKMPSALSK